MAVMKFGGTSVGTARAMQQAISIVAREQENAVPLVVLSACSGITNKLVRIADAAGRGALDEAMGLAADVRSFHVALLDELIKSEASKKEVAVQIEELAGRLEMLIKGVDIVGELTERSRDMFCSFGELFSTTVFAAAMKEQGYKVAWVDVRTVMITDDHFGFARPINEMCEENVRRIITPLLQQGTVVVTQGYIGATKDGKTTTLGRGGSDFSAALLGAWLNDNAIQIWTDVDGVMTCDPRLVPEARSIRVMTFSEAAELAYLGAKVLHPDTIAPAVQKNIPVYVLNSVHPDAKGTIITNDPERLSGMSYGGLVKSIAVKKGQCIINVRSNRMFGRHGFMNELFGIFARYGVSVEMISTSEVSVSLTVDEKSFSEELIHDLESFGEVDREHHVATISVVGDNLRMSRGVAGRIFSALKDVNLRMISQGASEINVGFVVEESEVLTAVNNLHREFFSGWQNEGIFETPAGRRRDYKKAGVDISAGEEFVRMIKPQVRQTFTSGVITDIGAFGGFFQPDFSPYKKPVLVSSIDGVGTKLKIAIELGLYDTVGSCLVNHCTNDILVCGAKPLFFLDYYACGKLTPANAAAVVTGMVNACRENGCALIGGETAEMPGLYHERDFDLAGSIVGVVDHDNIINGSTIEADDVLIGLPSTGLHTNGYSLARKVLEGRMHQTFTGLDGTVGEELLKVHRSYLSVIEPFFGSPDIRGLSHITGGGLMGNTMRIVPEGLSLDVDWKSWPEPLIFDIIRREGHVPEEDMRRTFNLGIGLVMIVEKKAVNRVLSCLKSQQENAYIIGQVHRR